MVESRESLTLFANGCRTKCPPMDLPVNEKASSEMSADLNSSDNCQVLHLIHRYSKIAAVMISMRKKRMARDERDASLSVVVLLSSVENPLPTS